MSAAKKYFFVMLAILIAQVSVSAQNMHIHKKDHTIITIPMSEIDKITYSNTSSPSVQPSAVVPAAAGAWPKNTENTVMDAEGNTYKTVRIGRQTWMAEDLRSTRFNTGATMPQIKDSDDWKKMSSPAYSWFDNYANTTGGYGILYNGYAIENGYLCPSGWHVPTVDDWDLLIRECGSMSVAGARLKAKDKGFWDNPNSGAEDSYGFRALGTGYRTSTGNFTMRKGTGLWWSSSQATYSNYSTLGMYYNYSSVAKGSFPKTVGACVRCIKDDF